MVNRTIARPATGTARNIGRLAVLAVAIGLLSGCVYAPPPPAYGYNPAYAYPGYAAYPAYAYPAFEGGFYFGGGGGHGGGRWH